ncbi:hypothetical protein [Paenibacillus aestuarii]|uniref:Uncharacterized protein n=1 Tax=Paenibacillus aestuarii TaxID=516965 RepID=A0ABW0KG99_9BACL|nr:hypothetical protein [Paenibacillus aestuarii]
MLWKRWTTMCLISVCVLFSAPFHTSAVDAPDRTSLDQAGTAVAAAPADNKPLINASSDLSLTDTVNKWKSVLAQKQGFENWQQANWQSYPLGPGTHGWVVIFGETGHEVGYMIIHAAEDGSLRLTEYGTGDSPLFSYTTLYRSLVQQALIPDTLSLTDFIQNDAIRKDRLYMDALTAVWKINLQDQTYYLDAKSGELLPLKSDPVPVLPVQQIGAADLTGITDERLLPAFDPYNRLPWVQGTPLQASNLAELKTALQTQEQLTYVVLLYGKQVTLPLAVIGYQQWGDNAPFLVLDHVGPRYVLLNEALMQGRLYP